MQLILAAIAFMAALKGTEGTTPAAGSPSGYAMRVQGQGDIAVPSKMFSAGSTPNDYPQNSTTGSGDQTWAMWIKAYHPLGGGKRMFLLGEAETFLFCPYLNFKDGFNSADGDDPTTPLAPSPIAFSAFVDELGTPGGTTGLTYTEFFDTWHHIAVTIEANSTAAGVKKTQMVKHYVDGVNTANDTMTQEIDFGDLPGFAVGQYAGFGKVYPDLNIVDDHFNGLMDEVAIYKKALTKDEIAAVMTTKHDTSDADLVMYWDFDDYSEFTSGTVTNLAGNSDWDLKLGEAYGETYSLSAASATSCRADPAKPHHYCDAMTKPQFVRSDIPSFGSTTGSDYVDVACYAVADGAAHTCELTGADVGDATATLTFAVGSQPSEGSVAVSGTTATFTAPSTTSLASVTFTYTVDSSSGGAQATGSATIFYASAPVADYINVQPYEDKSAEIIMVSYDPLGLKNSFEITALPAGGKIYALDGSGNVLSEVTAPNTVIETNRLKFIPDEDNVDTRTMTYKSKNAFAESSEANATITMTLHPDKPLPSVDQSADSAATLTEIDLGAIVADPDSDFFTVIVDDLPIKGKLYLENDASTAEVEQFDPFFIPPMESQYVSKVLELSNAYRTGSGGWSGIAIVGPPDAPIAYGDSELALCFHDKAAQGGKVTVTKPRCGVSISTGNDPTGNLDDKFDPDGTTYGGHHFGDDGFANDVKCNMGDGIPGCDVVATGTEIPGECWDSNARFLAEGWSQYFTVQFENQVYLKSLKVGINRGAGSITDVEAYDRSTGTWQTVFHTKVTNDIAAFDKLTNQYNTWSPYPLCEPSFKTDIIKFKVDSITVGDWNEFDYVEMTGSQQQSPGVIAAKKVYYEAGEDESCVDNFYFSATDCGGQAARSSSKTKFNVKPAGAATNLPSCATPVTVAVDVLSTEFKPAQFNSAYLDSAYNFSAIEDVNHGTWTYGPSVVDPDQGDVFTFNWEGTDSDKTVYDVSFNVIKNGEIEAIQSVSFEILPKYVYMTEDIEWTVEKCNSANKVDIKYDLNAAKESAGAIGGKSQPADSEFDCADVPADSAAGILVVIIAVAGCVVCGLFVAFMIIKKSHPVIKSSQPLFCIVYGVGCSMICIQMLFYLGEATNFSCGMRYWLFNIIFTLSFGALFAKTWRVWRVFSNTHLKKIRLTNMDTLRVMFMLLFVEVICLSLGQISAPFEPTEELVEFEVGRFLTQTVCKSSTSEWALLTMAYKVVLVIIGCYLSWTTRNVDSAFAESKYIMLAIYQVAIYGLVAAIVNGSGSSVEMTLLVQTFCCVFGAIFCVASVLVPKILLIQSGQYDDGFKSGSQGTSLNTGGSSGGNAEEVERLERNSPCKANK
ncbi:hypothetical protein TrRE_jg10491 [Triparma retinervis]|uniref:G-protein coupled receptors family 3 profile domain-containing protein n=1 Tax=Triparma retinervis TaxID=2557542 RepID=A0A9W7DW76_9STRA|nr:hypothetical protein TrRE_jg10491 [Triparma retinervis]